MNKYNIDFSGENQIVRTKSRYGPNDIINRFDSDIVIQPTQSVEVAPIRSMEHKLVLVSFEEPVAPESEDALLRDVVDELRQIKEEFKVSRETPVSGPTTFEIDELDIQAKDVDIETDIEKPSQIEIKTKRKTRADKGKPRGKQIKTRVETISQPIFPEIPQEDKSVSLSRAKSSMF